MSNKKTTGKKAIKELVAIKGTVLYYPNGNDHAVRPKDRALSAVIVNDRDHEYTLGEPGKERSYKRKVYTIVVFNDDETQPVVYRRDVPAKADMLEGEKYIELPGVPA